MPVTFKKSVIIIDGRNFFYWHNGVVQKEVAILLHGFPGTHEGLIDMARNLNDYHIIIPDLPDCGLSDPLGKNHTLKNYAMWLNDFMEKLSIKKSIIIGHSFGSRIALVFSAQYPKKVNQLILITPIVEVSGFLAVIASLYYGIAEKLSPYLQKKLLASRYYKQAGDMITFRSYNHQLHKKIIDGDIAELKHLNLKAHFELFNEYYKSSLLPISKKVTAKSLIIAGRLDEVAPLRSVQKLAKQLPDAVLDVMEHAGHFLPLEKPLETANIIMSWLGQG